MSALMMFDCTVLFDASSNVSVNARSAEEAAAMADELCSGRQNLCHQCSDTLDTGDSLGVLVSQGGIEVADTTWHATQIAELKAARAELLTALKMFVFPYQEADAHTDAQRQQLGRAAILKHGGAA